MNLIILKVDVIVFFFGGGRLVLKRFGNYLNSLIKIMVCGTDDIIFLFMFMLIVLLDFHSVSLG